jgi:hypothetical protein
MPGPEGTSYVAELINKVSMSTSGRPKISNPIEMKPMIAGKIEGMTVNDMSNKKLESASDSLTRYSSYQNEIGTNQVSIGTKINSINTMYNDMSNNNAKYDFTGTTISSLDEDRSMQAALTKDNAIYLDEQNNLYMVGTLTMATLLITAIFMSK